MMKRPFLRVGLLLAMSGVLSGCVAAAIPVVAGGLMIGGRGDDGSSDDTESSASARVDTPIETVTDRAAVEPVASPEPVGELAALPDDEPTQGVRLEGGIAGLADGAAEPVDTPLRAVAVGIPEASQAGGRPALSLRAYDSFYSYVDSQARRDPVERPRDSALLTSPGTLRPDRTECSIRPPAVLIDLDPGDGMFDHAVSPAQNNALSQMLAAMRMQDIEIFWISSVPAVQAGAVRRTLAASGLDPKGDDNLLLMRNGEDRKQERRRDLDETHCLVAIAGDTRADFDELYAYLKDRSTAQPLEELVGAGWFLTPLPIEQGQ